MIILVKRFMNLYPKKYISKITQIDKKMLEDNNIKGLILDVDNTLIDLQKKMPDEIYNWAMELKSEGIKLIIVSNTNKKEKVEKVAKKLGINYFYFMHKPLKKGFVEAAKKLNLKNENIASVGDQIFTDVWGANRCKMYSILVKPIEDKDIFITKLKRPFEKIVINGYLKKHRIEGEGK